MIYRSLASLGVVAAVIVAVSLASGPAGGQAPTAAASTQSAAAQAWTPPHTPWGEPDLQGVWRYDGATPLERPEEFAGREFLTDEEVAQIEQAEKELLTKKLAGAEGVDIGRRPRSNPVEDRPYNAFWQETGRARKASRRTSMIVGPDGKIPYTPAAQKREAAQVAVHSGYYPTPLFFQSWLELDTEDRCLTHGVPGELLGGAGGGPNQFVQSPGLLVILQEADNDRRIIPTDGRPHGNIRTWRGDAVGRWEGQTLIVETTQFADTLHYRWSSLWRSATETLRLAERFTRIDADTIDYQLTIEDPAKFTRPMTIVFPLTKLSVPLMEYACHEGNYGAIHSLSAVRNLEKAAAEAAKKGKKGSR